VQALDRGLQLLDLLGTTTEAMSLADLAEEIEVDRSTAHRLLATLVQRGYVRQEPRTKHYRLGLKLVHLGRRALEELTLRAVAQRYLKALVRASGETANLVVRAGGQATSVDLEPSPSILSVTSEIGTAFSPHATAAGKVLMAFLPEAEQLEWLGRLRLEGFTPRTLTSIDALLAQLKTVAGQGYAVDDEESHLGVRCVAAPIRDNSGQVVAAVSASGPAMRVPLERVPALAALVRKTAQDISAALGCPAGSQDAGLPT
jgi:DNA-binding IclR family transcriptional regulator